MVGAIIGDVAGSRFEWHNKKSKDFAMFSPICRTTDDTAMTLAIAKAIMEAKENDDMANIDKYAITWMQRVGKMYPRAGFGGSFAKWIKAKDPKPYNSCGNGSAMRVSPCAYASDDIEEVLSIATAVTSVTHNHPDGIAGACAVAKAIFLARTGKSKDDIKKAVEKYYPLNFTLDEIRKHYKFDVLCSGSVPQAVKAFLESTDFEDAIRNAISIGGDSDTIAAIAGSIAEPFYGVPSNIRDKVFKYLDSFQKGVVNDFEKTFPASRCKK